MKVAIIGFGHIGTGRLLAEEIAKCDFTHSSLPFVEKNKIDFEELCINNNVINVDLLNNLDKQLNPKLTPKYRRNNNNGSKYHK